MKRFFIGYINEWHNAAWIDWHLIWIGVEYSKYEPCLFFRFSIFGVGIELAFLCPWETKDSKAMRDEIAALLDNAME